MNFPAEIQILRITHLQCEEELHEILCEQPKWFLFPMIWKVTIKILSQADRLKRHELKTWSKYQCTRSKPATGCTRFVRRIVHSLTQFLIFDVTIWIAQLIIIVVVRHLHKRTLAKKHFSWELKFVYQNQIHRFKWEGSICNRTVEADCWSVCRGARPDFSLNALSWEEQENRNHGSDTYTVLGRNIAQGD